MPAHHTGISVGPEVITDSTPSAIDANLNSSIARATTLHGNCKNACSHTDLMPFLFGTIHLLVILSNVHNFKEAMYEKFCILVLGAPY